MFLHDTESVLSSSIWSHHQSCYLLQYTFSPFSQIEFALNSVTSPRIVLEHFSNQIEQDSVINRTGLWSGTKTGMKTSQEQLGWLWNALIIKTFQVFGLFLWFSKSSTTSIKNQQLYWSWHQERADSSSTEKTSSFLKSVFEMQHFPDM